MLTERQLQLLQAIIDDYINTAEPVGSVEIVQKYNLHCSPATIRNEMVKLIDQGFLEMLHTSSGRVPTKMAYRMYIDELMHEEELPVLQEVALKQRLWTNRFEMEKLLRETSLAMSEATGCLSIATTDEGFVTSAGTVNVLEHKEFWDIDIAKSVLRILDSYEILDKIFRSVTPGREVYTLIGDEIPVENLVKSTVIFTPYKVGEKGGFLAILGPSRLNYQKVIPIVKYTRKLLEELGGSW
jgi:transcriptional regulator of heat shock response